MKSASLTFDCSLPRFEGDALDVLTVAGSLYDRRSQALNYATYRAIADSSRYQLGTVDPPRVTFEVQG